MNIIHFRSLKNVRELSYGNIKNNRLIRSESLNHLSRREAKILKDNYELKVIIDLRTPQEANEKKDRAIEGVNRYLIPLIYMSELGLKDEKEGRRNIAKSHQLPDIYDYYHRLVNEDKKDAWTKIFSILLDNKSGSTLIHCTVGKDRCGIVVAVILLALGIKKEEVINDYLLTDKAGIIPFTYRLFALTLDKEFRKEFLEYFRAKEEYIVSALDYIDEKYGSIDVFLRDICSLDDTKLFELKRMYLK